MGKLCIVSSNIHDVHDDVVRCLIMLSLPFKWDFLLAADE